MATLSLVIIACIVCDVLIYSFKVTKTSEIANFSRNFLIPDSRIYANTIAKVMILVEAANCFHREIKRKGTPMKTEVPKSPRHNQNTEAHEWMWTLQNLLSVCFAGKLKKALVVGITICKTDLSVYYAIYLLEVMLGAPKASSRKVDFSCTVHSLPVICDY